MNKAQAYALAVIAATTEEFANMTVRPLNAGERVGDYTGAWGDMLVDTELVGVDGEEDRVALVLDSLGDVTWYTAPNRDRVRPPIRRD